MSEAYLYVETAPGMFSSESTCFFYDIQGKRLSLVVDNANIVRAPYGKLEALRVSFICRMSDKTSQILLPADTFSGGARFEVSDAILVHAWPYPQEEGARGAVGSKEACDDNIDA